MFPFGPFLNAAALWLILFVVAGHQADRSYSKLFFVSLGVSLAALGLSLLIAPWDMIATPIVCVLAMQRFCYIGWLRAVLSTLLFMGWWAVSPQLWKHLLN